MTRKIGFIIGGITLAIVIGIGGFLMFNKNHQDDKQNDSGASASDDRQEELGTSSSSSSAVSSTPNPSGKTAVIYFSATGTTKGVAEKIVIATGADLIEIQPVEAYTSADLAYNNDNCRANREQNDPAARPAIANEIATQDYDTIFLGYPIWWGTVPKIIFTFLDTHNLAGKTIVPFATSGGSSIAQSMSALRGYNSDINWLEGRRFSASVSDSEISEWIKGLGL